MTQSTWQICEEECGRASLQAEEMGIPVQGEGQLLTELSLRKPWSPETQLHSWESLRAASTGQEGP